MARKKRELRIPNAVSVERFSRYDFLGEQGQKCTLVADHTELLRMYEKNENLKQQVDAFAKPWLEARKKSSALCLAIDGRSGADYAISADVICRTYMDEGPLTRSDALTLMNLVISAVGVLQQVCFQNDYAMHLYGFDGDLDCTCEVCVAFRRKLGI